MKLLVGVAYLRRILTTLSENRYASITDLTLELSRPTTAEEVNGYLKAAAETGPLKGVMGYEIKPLVSSDYKSDPRSGIVDALSTMVPLLLCLSSPLTFH